MPKRGEKKVNTCEKIEGFSPFTYQKKKIEGFSFLGDHLPIINCLENKEREETNLNKTEVRNVNPTVLLVANC